MGVAVQWAWQHSGNGSPMGVAASQLRISGSIYAHCCNIVIRRTETACIFSLNSPYAIKKDIYIRVVLIFEVLNIQWDTL